MLPQLWHLIGSDRYLSATGVERAAAEPHPMTAAAWDAYERFFARFTGATLDPMFHRLAHPARQAGSLRLDPGTAVLVVGTGPSLAPNIEALKRLAGRVRIFTSPRGAEALLPHGIVPDLVLVEHQTALDAHHSARHVGDAARAVLSACPLVAADWRTPASLVADVPPQSLFVPSPLPTWGLWPATAAALAVDAGASRIALLGIDLGSAAQPDPAHLPLAAILGLIARLSPVVALDCGAGGAAKRGWVKATLDDAAGRPVTGACETRLFAAPDRGDRIAQACSELRELGPVLESARLVLDGAIAARSNERRASVSMLETALQEVMAWRDDARTRVLLQETLGLSFLPRLWRIGVDPSLGCALWRPLLLATHELVGQANALVEAVAMRKAA